MTILKQFIRIVTLWLVACVVSVVISPTYSQFASAQSKNSKGGNDKKVNQAYLSILDVKVAASEKELEDRVRRLLSSQLDSPYSVVVKIIVDQKSFLQKLRVFRSAPGNQTMPGLLNEAAGRFVRGMTIEDVFTMIKSINVSLTLDNSVSKQQEGNLSKSIFAALNLRKERRDKISIDRTDMLSSSFKAKQEAFDREQQSAIFQNKKLEMMLRELEVQNRTLSGKNNASGSSELLGQELRRIADDIKSLKESTEKEFRELQLKSMQAASEAKENTEDSAQKKNAGPLAGVKSAIAGLELPLTLFPLGIILALVLLKLASGQGKGALAVKAGFEELGKSVQTMADTLASAAKSISSDASNQQGSTATSVNDSGGQQQSSGGEGSALQLLKEEALDTWKILLGMPYFLLSVLKDWLSENDTRELFLQVTEAVGAESASWIWSCFPVEELEQLGALSNKAVAKASAFSSISLLYRSVVREASSKPNIPRDSTELEFLTRLTDEELVLALKTSEEYTVSVIMSLLTSARSVRIMNRMGVSLTAEMLRGVDSSMARPLAELSEVVQKFAIDAQHANEGKKRNGLLNCLVRIMDTPESSAQKAIRDYLSSNVEMAEELRKRVITFDDLMGLDGESIYELFGSMAPADVANLVFSLKPEHASKILSLFTGKVKLRVGEEMRKIQNKNSLKKKALVQAAKLKALSLRKAKAMRDQGLIEFDVGAKGNVQAPQEQQAS